MPAQTNIRLPHKEPLIFIGSLEKESASEVSFIAHFPIIPTLAMFCEAAAQGSTFFPLSPDCTMGVVTSFRNIKRITEPLQSESLMTVTVLHTFGNSYLFAFKAFAPNSQQLLATGEIAVFYTTV
ncbi:MAG TPA: hypothetical protein VFX66_01340 [Sulfuricurvum sp.]|nr:hypothetical protein [Sulfuricurvum sp.]